MTVAKPHESTVPTIDLFFTIGSTYTYLAVMRAPARCRERGIALNWRPFDVRRIMVEMDNIPFSTKPVKLAYMWRDLTRRAARFGHPFDATPVYPPKSFGLPNLIAIVAAEEGWCEAYAQAAYRNWFVAGLDPSIPEHARENVRAAGQDPERVLARAGEPPTRATLERQTDAARSLGIFGAPTFAVGAEIFWGDDRLEDALDHLLARRPA